MYKELIMPTEISIKDKKKLIKGTVLRAAIFARSKVIEVMTAESERFYLLYYKNSFIYGEKLEQIEKGSFIDKAFYEGIVNESPHPILSALIPNLTVTVPNKNKLFSQLQLHYSLQEVAYLATVLDSFFAKDQLIEILDKIFFHFRRSGKFLKAFQIMQILRDFAPALNSVKDRLDSHEFYSYHNFYDTSSLPSILKKDPLYVVLHCFKNRTNPEKRVLLEEILSQEESHVELLLVWLEKAQKDSIEKYTEMALRFISMEDWILTLALANLNPFCDLPETKSVMEKMIQKGNHKEAALYLFNFLSELPLDYEAILSSIWDYSESEFVIAHLDEFITLLKQLHSVEKTEQKIFQLSVKLLEKHDLKTVHEKLLPIQKLFPNVKVINKINEMAKLVEDPDRMMELGDCYAEFHQFDQAIDCFFWEMELQPQNPIPVQKISKMYQHKGMAKEAAVYQKICAQLKQNKEVG